MSETQDLPEELIIDFKEIVVGNNRVDRIVLHEPTGVMVRTAESELKSGVTVLTMRHYQIALISQVSGVPKEIIERMPVSKLNEASRYIQGFIDGGLRTGET